ncbi:hypothetical protein MKX01_041193 [Papaver californicum]|nr:hypothetical protein MKX01_041193 [Papaver californicum]
MNTDQIKKTWSNRVTEKLELAEPKWQEEHWKKDFIFDLPTFVKDRNVKAYEPQVVSIGPYHYSKRHLKPMEVHKRRALRHFVKRSDVPESYARQLDEEWINDNRFVELMIQDGCFILEFLAATANYHKINCSDALICSNLIDTLVVSAKDVSLLQSQGIILSSLGSDEAVVKVLKELARDTVVDSGCKCYVAVGEMKKYYEESMTKWRRRFLGDFIPSQLYSIYFSNLWSFISVGAAAFLLALALTVI